MATRCATTSPRDTRRAEAERACHAIAATRREETERRETQGWRDAPDGAELFAEGSDARNELKRLEAWLQTTEFRVKVDDERWRFPTRAAPPASSLLERRFVVSITSGAQKHWCLVLVENPPENC